MASFISEKELSKSRAVKRKLQSKALLSAQLEYEQKEDITRQRKQNSQDSWMTSSLENRLKLDADKHKSSHKGQKSHKKHKKKSKKKQPSSSEDSDYSDWVEKQPTSVQDDWMKEDFLSGVKTFSSKEIKERDSKKKEQVVLTTKSLSCFDQPGQHAKELNPYWKSGGDGMPTTGQNSNEAIPDVDWLKRSLKRMQEQSKESGCDIERIAADRYGSWEAFQNLLKKAHGKAGKHHKSSELRQYMKPTEERNSKVEKSFKRSYGDATPRWKKKASDVPKQTPKDKPVERSSDSLIAECVNKASKKSAIDSSEKLESTVTNKKKQLPLKILTEEEKNKIGAKIIKAELMGNVSLMEKLKKKLKDSKAAENESSQVSQSSFIRGENKVNKSSSENSESEEETFVLTRTDKAGHSWPVKDPENEFIVPGKKKKRKMKMHDVEGNRTKYFADDDKYSLKDLVEQERSGASISQTQTLSRLSAKLFTKSDGENYTLDDMFEKSVERHLSLQSKDSAISNHTKLMRRLENCKLCFGNQENPKHLIVAVGRVSYLRLPSHHVLQPGHCIISPMHHCSTGTSLDEDVWDEVRKFMQSLVNLFSKQGKDCIFLQTCMRLQKSPHFCIECVPLPKELGDVAPIYFKKAIQESEGEWTQNKKVIDTRGKSVKDKIPAGLPYFAVEFGLSGGFAHVVEDDYKFPCYFGREILGGMLDADPYLWRKPKEESFGEQMKRSVEFEKMFASFDWTKTELE